jgi:hypothetical protein
VYTCASLGVPSGVLVRLNMGHKLLAMVLVSVLSGSAQTTPSLHTISFSFDYDFRVTPACSPKVTKQCVQQFNFYDISMGIANREKLGSIPVPAGAMGLVKGISAKTESFLFGPGRHRLAVSAQMPNGDESDLSKCTIIVKIP